MLPTTAGVEPATSWSPVGWRIQLSHRNLNKSSAGCNDILNQVCPNFIDRLQIRHFSPNLTVWGLCPWRWGQGHQNLKTVFLHPGIVWWESTHRFRRSSSLSRLRWRQRRRKRDPHQKQCPPPIGDITTSWVHMRRSLQILAWGGRQRTQLKPHLRWSFHGTYSRRSP